MKPLDPDVTHIVSYWVIPGGYDYNNAFVHEDYFTDEQEARLRLREVEDIPEMGILMTREEWERTAVRRTGSKES